MSSPLPITSGIDLLELRRCLARFATGVTVVTCKNRDDKPCGVTANSFTSVSLEPPLVLWNISRNSSSINAYRHAEYFAINVLTADQRELSSHFAKSGSSLFNVVSYENSVHGVPVLNDTLAWMICRTYQIHECGDHYIIVGEVKDFHFADGPPLLFFNGRYSLLTDDR